MSISIHDAPLSQQEVVRAPLPGEAPRPASAAGKWVAPKSSMRARGSLLLLALLAAPALFALAGLPVANHRPAATGRVALTAPWGWCDDVPVC